MFVLIFQDPGQTGVSSVKLTVNIRFSVTYTSGTRSLYFRFGVTVAAGRSSTDGEDLFICFILKFKKKTIKNEYTCELRKIYSSVSSKMSNNTVPDNYACAKMAFFAPV